MSPLPAASAVIVAMALGVAFGPRPAALIERGYGILIYPTLQAVVTGLSNRLPFAAFDVGIVVVVGALLRLWGRAVTAVWRRREWRSAGRASIITVTLAAALYLWFVAVWGLNYARPPLESRMALSDAPPTAVEVSRLLETAVAESNRLHPDAHGDRLVPYAAERDVARALAVVDASHGRPRPTVPGTPKPTLLAPYFRMAGVDGLTAPLLLETLLNPDLTAMERPFTLAHEWAHLSGHAPEADANVVAWLVTQASADPITIYSGWLFLVSETSWQVPSADRARLLAPLEAGPRRDLAEIARRAATRVDVVERVGWRVYDSYLRSQGVDDGVRSYSRAVALIVRWRRGGAGAPPVVPQ